MSLFNRLFESSSSERGISPAQMLAFHKSFDRGDHRNQRFGQAFMNTHGDKIGVPPSHGLWEMGRKAAEKHIWDNHVDVSPPALNTESCGLSRSELYFDLD